MVEQQWDDPVRRFFREPVTRPLEYFETVGPVDKAPREQCGFAAQGAVFGSPNVECRDGNAACGIRQVVGEGAIPVQRRGKRARFAETPHVFVHERSWNASGVCGPQRRCSVRQQALLCDTPWLTKGTNIVQALVLVFMMERRLQR